MLKLPFYFSKKYSIEFKIFQFFYQLSDLLSIQVKFALNCIISLLKFQHEGLLSKLLYPRLIQNSLPLFTLFQSVDQDRSGQITAIELQRALVNGNWTPFNEETCRLMIGMFDKDRLLCLNIACCRNAKP